MVTVLLYASLLLGKYRAKFQMIFSNSVLLSRYVCSYNKTNGHFRQYQIQTEERLDTVFCFIFL